MAASPRRVLCLFHHFPPTGGAGAIRAAAIVRELPRHDWAPTVIAPRGPVHHTPGDGLAVPPDVPVVRTRAWDLRSLLAPLRPILPAPLLGSLARTVLLPDPQAGWMPFAFRAADRLLATGGFQALYSSGAPWSVHLTALRLARRHRLPWVAAFADEWSTSSEVAPPTSLHRRLHRHWERQVLAGASAMTGVTATLVARVLAAHPGLSLRTAVVANGYDEADFAGREARLPDRFTLMFAGTVYPQRAPWTTLDALAAWLAGRADLRPRVRFRILGHPDPAFDARVKALGLEDVVAMEGARSHGETVQAMLDAHVLVVEMPDEASTPAARPVKLFEYLRAGRPILGFMPPGEASSLLAPHADCADLRPGDAAGGVRCLQAWFADWETGRWPAQPSRRPGSEAFTRETQVAALASLLDKVAS